MISILLSVDMPGPIVDGESMEKKKMAFTQMLSRRVWFVRHHRSRFLIDYLPLVPVNRSWFVIRCLYIIVLIISRSCKWKRVVDQASGDARPYWMPGATMKIRLTQLLEAFGSNHRTWHLGEKKKRSHDCLVSQLLGGFLDEELK